jgi:hypothetical protein
MKINNYINYIKIIIQWKKIVFLFNLLAGYILSPGHYRFMDNYMKIIRIKSIMKYFSVEGYSLKF